MHYCAEWDYMVVGLTDPEFEVCTCYDPSLFIKLVSKKDEWFVEGTEVWDEDTDLRFKIRDFQKWVSSKMIVGRGLRIKESDSESQSAAIGEAYIDGEYCSLDEFVISVVSDDGADVIKEIMDKL
jgi:hypothetical protein